MDKGNDLPFFFAAGPTRFLSVPHHQETGGTSREPEKNGADHRDHAQYRVQLGFHLPAVLCNSFKAEEKGEEDDGHANEHVNDVTDHHEPLHVTLRCEQDETTDEPGAPQEPTVLNEPVGLRD